jgi:RNA polymerase sigma factor (sigma-70 family)
MASSSPPPSADELLAHAGWLKRLARQLVRDGDVAEDAAQDAWASALRAPPAPERPPRPWMAEVLRNVVRMRLRGERRRARWENEAAQSAMASDPSPEGIYERVELHRILLDSVMKLDEPLRATVLLRFFDERSSPEIARLTGVSAGTVRWRLKTAIERLRLDLDRRFGGERRRWAVALAPVGKGTVLFMAKTKAPVLAALAAAAVLLFGGGVLWLARDGDEPPESTRGIGESPAIRGWSGWALPPAEPDGAGILAGTVVSPEGVAVESAEVTLIRATSRPTGWDIPAVAASIRTGAGGGFRFDGIAAGSYQVVAVSKGWAPGRRGGINVERGGLTQVELQLSRGGIVLSGRVTDVGGGPVVGATITTAVGVATDGGRSVPYVMRAVTASDGRYQLASRPGTHRLQVEASGYAPAEAYLTLNDARSRDFVLTPAAGVAGVVVDRASARPVPEAEVLLLPDRSGPRNPEVDPLKTDAEGRFSFTSIEPGRYVIRARKGRLASAGQIFTVSSGERLSRDVVVDPAASVSGRVLDGSGHPVAGALVQLSAGMFSREPPLRARSDTEGRYRIEGVLPGLYTARAQEEEEGLSIDGVSVTMTEKDLEGVDLRIARQAWIEGQVLGMDGRPAAEVEVTVGTSIHRPGRMMQMGKPAVTDDQGRFRVGITAGVAGVSVLDPVLGRASEKLGEVRPGETRRVTVRLHAGGGAKLSGLVRYDDGRPGAGLAVRAFGDAAGARGRTDPEGRFTLAGLQGGTLKVRALADEDSGYLGPDNMAEVEVALAATEHRREVLLTLPARRRITGRVLTPDGGPAVGVTVLAGHERDGRAHTGRLARTSTATDGSFVFDDLASVKHTIWAIHDSYPDAETAGVAPGVQEVVLRFSPGARIEGRVVDGQGRAVKDYLVTARFKGESTRKTMRSDLTQQVHDPAGTFGIERLPPGSYEIEASAAAGGRAELELTLAEGETKKDLRMTLTEPSSVAGQVLDYETGAPVSGVEIWTGLPLGRVVAFSDVQGRFTLDGLPAGRRVHLSFGAPGYVSDGLPFDVPKGGGEGETVVLKLVRGNDERHAPRSEHGLALEMAGTLHRIKAVGAASPAAASGILAGEHLESIDGKNLGLGVSGVRRLLDGDPGREIRLGLRSVDGRRREVTLKLAASSRPR